MNKNYCELEDVKSKLQNRSKNSRKQTLRIKVLTEMRLLKKRILKFNLAILLLSILFGMFIFQVEQYSRDKVTDFFRYTDSYSPVKKPKKITNKKENDSAIDIIEKNSKQEGLFTLYKVVDQGYFIEGGINFKFLPKEEITLYSPNMHQKSAYSPPLSKSVLTIDSIDNLKNANCKLKLAAI